MLLCFRDIFDIFYISQPLCLDPGVQALLELETVAPFSLIDPNSPAGLQSGGRGTDKPQASDRARSGDRHDCQHKRGCTPAAELQAPDSLIGPRNKKPRKKRSPVEILPQFQITNW
jgi:hypothetical protein